MKSILKIFLWLVLSIIVLLGVLLGGFIYKVKYGFPVFFETEIPNIDFPDNKTTGAMAVKREKSANNGISNCLSAI